MGSIVLTTPGGEIPTALKSGAIDAAEWIGPWVDIAFGLDKAVDYYYYPGFTARISHSARSGMDC